MMKEKDNNPRRVNRRKKVVEGCPAEGFGRVEAESVRHDILVEPYLVSTFGIEH